MKVAIIGRSQLLYRTAELLLQEGFEIRLVVTAKEAPEYTVTSKDFEAFAARIGAKYLYTPRIDMAQCISAIEASGAVDIAVSINYTGVIPQNVIDLFPRGILNVHAGDLPRYRGNAPLAWAIINREERIGLCVHQMIGGELDSGNILAKDYKALSIDTRVGQLFDWIEERSPSLVLEALTQLRADPAFKGEEQSKNPPDALRCYPRNPSDGRIDWKADAETIVRLIHASSEPLPGAFATLDEQPVTLWRAALHQDDERYSAVPGQIAAINADGSVVVITGNGKIIVSEVGQDGQRCSPATLIKSVRKRFA